jgi:anthranilate phosphoribosyltransferase
MPARKKIKEKTLFNLLGPLANPAGATRQIVGVYSEGLVTLFIDVLRDLGATRAMVVHGSEGLDEISLSGPTSVAELANGTISRYTFTPEDAGFQRAPLDAFVCTTPQASLALAKGVIEGAGGAPQDVVALNAGAALMVAGLVPDVRAGAHAAQSALSSGRVLKKVSEIAAFTQAGA